MARVGAMAHIAALVGAIAVLAASVSAQNQGFAANYPGGGTVAPTDDNTVPCTVTTFGPDFGCTISTGYAGCTRSGKICNQYLWEYSNYKYFVLDEKPNLPKPFTGVPRIDARTNKEYVGQMALNESYYGSVIGQVAPGFCIAILLFTSMLSVLIFYIVSSCWKCCGLCKCCFRPFPYTRKQLHIAKGIQLLFVALTACGCFVIFSASPDVTDGIQSIVEGLFSAARELIDDVHEILDALPNNDISSQMDGLSNATDIVEEAILKTSDAIDRGKEQVQLVADIVSGILFGVAVLTMILSVLNFWRILILFAVLTSLILFLCWIVVGVLAAMGVFLDDFCFTLNEYLIDPNRVSFSKDIPCPKAKEVMEFSSGFRTMVATFVHEFNTQLYTWNSANSGSLKYICMPYQTQNWDDLCGTAAQVQAGTFEAYLWDDDYANYACKTRHDGSLDAAFISSNKPMPKWDSCSYTNHTFNNAISSSAVTLTQPLDTLDVNDYSALGSDTANSTLTDVVKLAKVIPTAESIIKCEFISKAFAAMSPGCGDTVEAIQMVWRGYIVTGVGYLCLWITMLVTLGRMSNPDLMIDGGRFDARKAGLI